ncbi:MAG TPA: sensor domain-containing diguanylate cyclase [Longimicrobiales bacterium]|nr:sensor domain-containing diguanylate cyclase [Longimicrobiales bacterium]
MREVVNLILMKNLSVAISPTSEDLFATIFEQTQQVLGPVGGFYVVTLDAARGIVRLVFEVCNGEMRHERATFPASVCDVIREAHPVINDSFVRSLCDDVVDSIAVPISRNGVVLGAFGAYSVTPRVYDKRDSTALLAIAKVAALALENARFLAEIEKARIEAEQLEEIGRAVTSSLDYSEVLCRIVNAALDMSGADSATVWLLRNDRNVEVAMTAGEIAPRVGTVLAVPSALRRRMADQREPYFVYNDVKNGDHELPLSMRNLTPARSTMGVALIAEGQVLGALSVGHLHSVEYTDADVRVLQRLSFPAAIAVTNARLHEQIRALSLTDPLTVLPNRRHLDMFLEKEFAAARRGRRLSVLIFDLDHFKQYNDRAGHQAGDDVLRAFARVLDSQTRAMNLAARYGGDEFITIIADTDRRGAQAHAERIIRAMAKDPMLSAAGISASVGIASFSPEMASFEDLIRAADRDLYSRKVARVRA